MAEWDMLFVSHREMVDQESFSGLPLDRLELFRSLVYPRMVYHRGRFLSHDDLLNSLRWGVSWHEAEPARRRELTSVWNLPSFSSLQIGSHLQRLGMRVRVVNNLDAEWDLFRDGYASSSRPPLVGLSTTFHLNAASILKTARRVREVDPAMRLVAGGAFVQFLLQTEGSPGIARLMKKARLDFCLLAQHPEEDLALLIRALRGAGRIEDVPNLAWLNAGARGEPAVTFTAPVKHPPLFAPFAPELLTSGLVKDTVQLRTSCGCPFRCAFCSYPRLAGGLSQMSLETLASSLETVAGNPAIRRLIFIDDTFNVPKERFRKICALLGRHAFEWSCFFRVQFVDPETVAMMRDAGCRKVYLGLESANDGILARMNKRATRREYERGIASLRRNGIHTVAAFVLGFPGETDATIEENIRFIDQSGTDYFTLKEFFLLENTKVYEERDAYGLSGSGNSWRHHTMDSDAAYDRKIHILRSVRNARFVDSDTSLWYLEALAASGLDDGEAAQVQGFIQRILVKQLDEGVNAGSREIAELERYLQDRPR